MKALATLYFLLGLVVFVLGMIAGGFSTDREAGLIWLGCVLLVALILFAGAVSAWQIRPNSSKVLKFFTWFPAILVVLLGLVKVFSII